MTIWRLIELKNKPPKNVTEVYLMEVLKYFPVRHWLLHASAVLIT